jgi:hypothetical protein
MTRTSTISPGRAFVCEADAKAAGEWATTNERYS